jgi:NAD(P)-dependent dehydrogenase (short-subunit alcohol dehydrogenase family)
MEDLTGKVAVITGAGRGIGRLAAVRLAGLGARVVLVARSARQISGMADFVAARGGTAVAIQADVGSPKSVASMKAEVESRLGAPSILINAAGIFGPIQLAWKTDPAAWINTIMVNAIGPYLTCHAFVESMMRNGWGRIVNVTSAATLHEPGPINSAYGTSKAALNQFTRHLAAELAGSGVTANVIHPGDVKTDMWMDIRDGVEGLGPVAQRYRDWAAWIESNGGDDPEKASDLIEALMSERAAAINGRFLWIKDGLQSPIPSWGEFRPSEAWDTRANPAKVGRLCR